MIDEHLVKHVFKTLKSDPCVYNYSKGGAIVIPTLYIDDVLPLGKNILVLRPIKQMLMDRLLMTGMGGVARARDGRYP
ncbi:unnamed protein product [Scytosiphon promiscuus]